jgi:hypothetical protein
MRRVAAAVTRDSEAWIEGWVLGYSDTERTAARHERANSESAALWSADIGLVAGVGAIGMLIILGDLP